MNTSKRESPKAVQRFEAPSVGLASPVVQKDYSTDKGKNQAFCVSDTSIEAYEEHKELNERFSPKKKTSELLSESYERLGLLSKSERVLNCGSFLNFAHEIIDGSVSSVAHLHQANFCRDRLCPLCSWRRSLKIFGQVSAIMEQIGSEYKFLFLTLTVPNVAPNELTEALNKLFEAWHRFISYSRIKSVVKGYFRALEITRNKENGTYHPHFHCILAVPPSYGKHLYIPRGDWLFFWRKACRDESILMVDIRLIRPKQEKTEQSLDNALEHLQKSIESAVAEATKYTCKDSDYIVESDKALTDEIVGTLTPALYHRRLSAFGGVFKDIFQKLGFEDAESETADLTHINDKLNPAVAWLICRYGWSVGAYKLIDSYISMPNEH